jgi:hypothetical protein
MQKSEEQIFHKIESENIQAMIKGGPRMPRNIQAMIKRGPRMPRHG